MASGGSSNDYCWATPEEAERHTRKIKDFPHDKDDVFESESTYEGDAGLTKCYETCTKNPGHYGFKPIDDYTLDSLPEGYRDQDIYDCSKALAAITVLVKVFRVSNSRPQFIDPVKKILYPYYEKRGHLIMRTGTGRIRYVTEKQDGPCICQSCERSGQPKTTWFKVGVVTATHLVYDEEEARQTRCTVGYDSDTSAVDTIDGVGISAHGKTVEGDRFNLCCVTHDPDLAEKLRANVARYKNLTLKVREKFKVSGPVSKLVIVVSHPHGKAKKVSIGQWSKKVTIASSGYSVYKYDAPTCPGTSGAAIYIPDKKFGWCNHVHSSCSVKNGKGKTGAGYA